MLRALLALTLALGEAAVPTVSVGAESPQALAPVCTTITATQVDDTLRASLTPEVSLIRRCATAVYAVRPVVRGADGVCRTSDYELQARPGAPADRPLWAPSVNGACPAVDGDSRIAVGRPYIGVAVPCPTLSETSDPCRGQPPLAAADFIQLSQILDKVLAGADPPDAIFALQPERLPTEQLLEILRAGVQTGARPQIDIIPARLLSGAYVIIVYPRGSGFRGATSVSLAVARDANGVFRVTGAGVGQS